MDKATPENKSLLGHFRKCFTDTGTFSNYCFYIVAIVGTKLKIERSTYEILQVLGISLLDKTHVKELFANMNYNDVKEPFDNQLAISLF